MKKGVLVCCLICVSASADDGYNHSVSLVGGTPGIIKYEYRFDSQLGISLGLDVEKKFAPGAQLYFRGVGHKWQPRLGLYYGVVGSLDERRENPNDSYDYSTRTHYFRSVAAEIGQVINFGESRHHAMELSLILPFTDGGRKEKKEELNQEDGLFDNLGEEVAKLHLAYRYNF